jgi:hypothetical protein
VLTNGDEYRIYNSHAPVDVEQKLFRSVRASDTANVGHVLDTLQLLSKEQMQGRLLDELWKVHFIDGNVSRSIESLLANEDAGLVKLLCNKAKGITPAEVRASLKRAKIRIDFPTPTLASRSPLSVGNDTQAPGSVSIRRKAGQKAWQTITAMGDANVGNLIEAGLIRPPLQIERDYKGVHLTAMVRPDGKVEFDGQAYDSLSTAAGIARKSVIGAPEGRPYPQTNGWTFWMYPGDSGAMVAIDRLRQNYLAQKKLRIVPTG